jgi:hypothetical protein
VYVCHCSVYVCGRNAEGCVGEESVHQRYGHVVAVKGVREWREWARLFLYVR